MLMRRATASVEFCAQVVVVRENSL